MNTQGIDELKQILRRLFGRRVGLDVILQQIQSGVRLVVCNISFNGTRQTAVVLRSADLHVPQIAMSHRTGDIFETVFGSLNGFDDVSFDDSPGFTANYQLQTLAEVPTRVMFTEELREFFSRNPGWSIRGHGFNLVVFRDNQVCNDEVETENLVRQCLEILSQVRAGERALDARPGVRREASPEKLAEAASPGGLVGVLLGSAKSEKLTREELDNFIFDVAPRRIPRGLRVQVIGNDIPFIIVGVVLFLVGVASMAAVVSSETGLTRLMGVPFLIFSVVGIKMILMALPDRFRKHRLLKNGRLAAATVTQVSRSQKSVDGYDVALSYVVDGEQQTTECWIPDSAGRTAYTLQRSGDDARILVDPKDASRVLCLDFVRTTV